MLVWNFLNIQVPFVFFSPLSFCVIFDNAVFVYVPSFLPISWDVNLNQQTLLSIYAVPHTVLVAGNVLASKQTIVAYRIYYFSIIVLYFIWYFACCFYQHSSVSNILSSFLKLGWRETLSLVPLESNFFQLTLKLAYAVSLRLISYRRGKPIIIIFVIDFWFYILSRERKALVSRDNSLYNIWSAIELG